MDVEDISGYYQYADQMFAWRFVVEKVCELGFDFYLLFIDLKQACDTVDRKYLYETAKNFWIPEKLISW